MTETLPLTILIGFLLGLRHATDPDHVVAVATIVSHSRSVRGAGSVGVLWGIGHSLTILAVGGALVAFRVAIAPRVGLALEFGVALMLVVLGVLNLRRAHPHGEHRAERTSGARPLLVGVVHGLAGTGAIAVAVVPLIPDPAWAIVYLLLFGAGTVAGMTVVTAAIAVPAALAAARIGHVHRYLRLTSGVVSIAFGLFLAHQIGVVDGLFGAAPQWTPR
jgi:hypothetical protein